jgi:hypothetical protein
LNRLDIVKLASIVGAEIEGSNWVFTLDQLEEYTKQVQPKPLDMHRIDEYLPAWAYLELTDGMRKEIVYVIQKQLGVI